MYEIIKLPVDKLVSAEYSYNRPIRDYRVNSIAKKFDIDKFHDITVSLRDSHYYIVDGNHRVAILKKLGINEVQCRLHFGLSYEEEALLFCKLNEKGLSKAVTDYERLIGKLEGKDEDAIKMSEIINKHGFRIDAQKEDNRLVCVSTITKIYERYGADNFDKTLFILRTAWQGDKDSLKRYMVEGIAYLLDVYKDEVDAFRLAEKLKNISVSRIYARADADPMGGQTRTKVARQILTFYNKNLSTSKKIVNKL